MIPEVPSSRSERAGSVSVFVEGKTGSTCRVSFIVPALNEGGGISAILDRVVNDAGGEVLVVDGGSDDNTFDIARKAGARCLRSAPGRAAQMNAGAFRLAFNDPRFSLLLIAGCANLLSHFRQLPCGDKAFFLRRETFEASEDSENSP